MKSNLVEALIGAAVLALAFAFFLFTYNRTDFGTVSGYELEARFNRVDGLDIGADVRLSGIRVGSVISQTLDIESYDAVVKISVEPDVQLPTDTMAQITSEGLLGGSYLALVPGGMDEYLEPGDAIEFTQGSVDLFGLIGQAIFSVSGDKDEDKEGDKGDAK